ncbi:MAG: hypothetical protein GKS06_17400 [Acidobacteria bacterium]|nr:hypothetical protein [Acidobacteriota bacterium]
MNSQAFFIVAGIFAAVIGLGGGWWAAQPHNDLSQYDRLGAEIGCQCGTCPKRPIATCGCAFADGMLGELAELTDGSRSDAEVMETFAVRYDPSVRIKPAADGLGLLAWIAPMLMLTVGAVGVGALLTRWIAMQQADEALADSDSAVVPAIDLDDDALAIVERELADLDT